MLNKRAVQGSQVVEFDSYDGGKSSSGGKLCLLKRLSNLWQKPGNTSEPFLHFKDGAFQPAVGEGVLLVEGQPALVGEITVAVFWIDLLNVLGRYKRGREVEEMLKA